MSHSEHPFFHVGLHSPSQCTGLAGEMLCPFLSPGGTELSRSSRGLWWELRQLSASLQPSACSGQMQRNNSHMTHAQAQQHNSALNAMRLWQGTKIFFPSVPAAVWGSANDRIGFPFVKDVPFSSLLSGTQVFERKVMMTNPLKAFQQSSPSPENLTFSYKCTLW